MGMQKLRYIPMKDMATAQRRLAVQFRGIPARIEVSSGDDNQMAPGVYLVVADAVASAWDLTLTQIRAGACARGDGPAQVALFRRNAGLAE